MDDVQTTRRFRDEEVRHILRRALALEEGRSASLSYEELLHAAREVGVSSASLALAVREMPQMTGTGGTSRGIVPHCIVLGTGTLLAILLSGLFTAGGPFLGRNPLIVTLMLSGGAALGAAKSTRLRSLVEFQIRSAAVFLGAGVPIVERLFAEFRLKDWSDANASNARA